MGPMCAATSPCILPSGAGIALAALALVLLALGTGSATTLEEAEPNNDPSEADRIPVGFGDAIEGSCVASADFASIFYGDHRSVAVHYSIRDGQGKPGRTTLSLYSPSGVEFRRQEVEGTGAMNVSLYEGADYTVAVRCSGTVDRWRLWVETVSTNTAPVGPNESEHNDVPSLASNLTAVNGSRGYGSVTTDPLDVWRVPAGPSGDVVVNLTTEPRLQASLWTVGLNGQLLTPAGNRLTLRGVALADAYLAVVMTSGSGYYNLTSAAAPPPAASHQGPSEREPNDFPAMANGVVANESLLISGESNLADDPADFFTIEFPYPATATIELVGGFSCKQAGCEHLSVLELNGSDALDPFGEPLDGGLGFHFPAARGSKYLLRLDSGNPGAPYGVRVVALPYPLEDGAQLELNDANRTGRVHAFATGSGDHPELRTANLAKGGDGTLYGHSLWLYVESRAPVGLRLTVLAGTRMKGEDPDMLRYVVTRNETFNVSQFGLKVVPLVAVIEGPYADTGGEGLYPDYGVPYYLDGRATGNLSRVTNQTSDGRYDYKAELLAVWAAKGIPRDTMNHYGATAGEVSGAVIILNAAGVYTALNPAPAPRPATPLPTPAGSFTLPLGLLVGLGLLGLIALGVAASRAGKQRNLPPLTIAPGLQGGAIGPQPGAPAPGAQPGQAAWAPYPPGYYAYPGYSAPVASARYAAPAPPPPAPGVSCPKCAKVSPPSCPYCTFCGEFFVR